LVLVPELDPKSAGLVPIWLELTRTGGSNCRNQVTAPHTGLVVTKSSAKEGEKERGGRKEKKKEGREHTKDSLGSFGANLVSGAAMIRSPETAAGISSLTCLLACSLACSLLVMRRRTLILETQLVDF